MSATSFASSSSAVHAPGRGMGELVPFREASKTDLQDPVIRAMAGMTIAKAMEGSAETPADTDAATKSSGFVQKDGSVVSFNDAADNARKRILELHEANAAAQPAAETESAAHEFNLAA